MKEKMRKTIGPGLAVVPTFEDMIGRPPAVKTAPPPLKYSDIMDNPLYQSFSTASGPSRRHRSWSPRSNF